MKTLLLILISALAALAQPPRGFFPWWDSPIVRDLNLTDDQRKQVDEIVREYRTRLIDLRAAVDKAEGEVEDRFNDDTPEPKKTNEAIERLVAARSELTRAFSQMSLKLRIILTADQWHELLKRRPKGTSPTSGRMWRAKPRRAGKTGDSHVMRRCRIRGDENRKTGDSLHSALRATVKADCRISRK